MASADGSRARDRLRSRSLCDGRRRSSSSNIVARRASVMRSVPRHAASSATVGKRHDLRLESRRRAATLEPVAVREPRGAAYRDAYRSARDTCVRASDTPRGRVTPSGCRRSGRPVTRATSWLRARALAVARALAACRDGEDAVRRSGSRLASGVEDVGGGASLSSPASAGEARPRGDARSVRSLSGTQPGRPRMTNVASALASSTKRGRRGCSRGRVRLVRAAVARPSGRTAKHEARRRCVGRACDERRAHRSADRAGSPSTRCVVTLRRRRGGAGPWSSARQRRSDFEIGRRRR